MMPSTLRAMPPRLHQVARVLLFALLGLPLACADDPSPPPPASASADTSAPARPSAPAAAEGLVVLESPYGVDETYRRLEEALAANPAVRILARVDHRANAEGVGATLPPTRLLLFGNPRLGTRLMQAERTVGIDLPMKMLVWEDAAGRTHLAYNDPAYLARRHGLAGQDSTLQTMAGALRNLAARATGSG